jgi:outer membrane protein insertion porin family
MTNQMIHLKHSKWHIFITTLFLLFMITSPLLGESKSEKQIAKFTIIIHNLPKGAEVNEDAILKQMKSKLNEPFSQNSFDEDLKHLSTSYNRIDPTIEYHNNEVFITLNLWPKPVIGKIIWEGNTHIKTKKLNKELEVKVGSTYERDNFVQAFNNVKLFYAKEGYYEAQLSYKVVPVDEDNNVTIKITIDEGTPGKVAKIKFTGLTESEEKTARERMLTKTYFFLTSWYDNKGILNKEMLEQDRLHLLQYLQNQGYANAVVTTEVTDKENDSERIVITFNCIKGSVFTCGKILFSGNTLFSDAQIDKVFAIRSGDLFSPEKIRETVKKITTLYGAQGYIDSNVSYAPHLIPGKNMYSIDFKIFEGEKYKVGMIKLFGNTSTHADVILHESLIVPGEVFDSRKLEQTEERLRNIGYFENVNVYAVQSNENNLLGPTFRDVYIEVVETNTGNLSFFFGFSTLTNIFGGIELTEHNFNYKGLSRIFKDGPAAIRGGGESLRLRFNVGRKEYMYFLSWTKPYFMDTKWSVGFDLEQTSNRMISDDYDINAFGASLHAGYSINPFLRFSTHYRFRNSHVDLSSSSNISQNEKNEANNDGIVSAVGTSLLYNTLNHPFEPTNGFRSKLGGEFAGLGGNYTFFKADYLNSYYFRFTPNTYIKYKADARFVLPVGTTTYEKLPFDERLFLGGENSVRGYSSYHIGPKFSDGDPKGGISSMLLSVEYNYRAFQRVEAFTFIDTGSVTSSEFQISKFRYSWGFGTRVKIIGNIPITIGMGFPVNAQSDEDVRKFFISLGGNF